MKISCLSKIPFFHLPTKKHVRVFFTVLAKTVLTFGCALKSKKIKKQWSFVIKKNRALQATSALKFSKDDHQIALSIMSKHPECRDRYVNEIIEKAVRITEKILVKPECLKRSEALIRECQIENNQGERELFRKRVYKRVFKALMELDVHLGKGIKKNPKGKNLRKLFGEKILFIKRFDKSLGCYAIQKKIGYGAFNKAYLAIDLTRGKFKVYRTSIPHAQQNINDLKTEYKLQRKIRNYHSLKKSVIKIECEIYKDFRYGAITQLGDHGTVSAGKENNRFSSEKKKKIVDQIAIFLTNLHAKNIVYGDFKSENFYLKKDMVKIGDFGGSHPKRGKNPKIVTPNYVPPEIYHNGESNSKTDCWALGIFLYEMKYRVGSDKKSPPFFDQVHLVLNNFNNINDMMLKQAKEIVQRNLRKPSTFLNVNDPYDQVIIGLLDFHPKKRLSAKQAAKLLKIIPSEFYSMQNTSINREMGSLKSSSLFLKSSKMR